MATTVARLQAVLGADTDQFDRAMNKSEGRIGKMGKVAALGGLAIAGGLAVGMKKSVDAAMEAEKAEARLTQAMDQAKISAKQRALANEAISKTSRRAALDDEDLSDVYAKLIRTTGSVKKSTDGMNLAADIARSRNVSLEVAVKAVERAYNGSAAGLGKFGVVVDKTSEGVQAAKLKVDTWRDANGKLTESEQVKAKQLIDSARQMDKVSWSQDTLAKAQERFAGGAEAYGKTTAGAQERFQVAVENLQEAIGKKLLPILAKLAETALRVIEAIERNWPRIMAAVGPVMEDIKRVVQNVMATLDRFWTAHGDTVKRVLNTIKDVIQNWVQVISGIVDVFMGVFTGDWRRAWNGIKDIVGGVFDNIKLMFTNVLPLLGLAAKKIGKAIADAVIDGIGDLGKALWKLVLDAVDYVKSKIPSLPKIELNPLKWGDARDPNMTLPSTASTFNGSLMGANAEMAPFAANAAAFGLRVTSGLRPGAITANGTPSDHGIGKALDLAGSAAGMAAFFKSLIGSRFVKQAFYDPLGSIFGGVLSSYREGGHSDHVHVATYDKGGWLKPGLTLAYNGTGQNERVGGGNVTIPVSIGGEHIATVVWDQIRQKAAVFERRNGRSAF